MFEWEDKAWFPQILRTMQTDFIGWLVEVTNVYQDLGEEFYKGVELYDDICLIDLCSGSGGPVKSLMSGFKKNQSEIGNSQNFGIQVTLTDKFPTANFSKQPFLNYESNSIDALDVPDRLVGIRTMFNAYHHFNEAQKQSLIQLNSKHGFLVAEILTPDLLCLLKILFTTLIGQLLLAPFVKPFSFQRIVFTYFLPINLFTVTWDGLVSVLKSEKFDAMKQRVEQFAPSGCFVTSGTCGKWYAPVNWFYIKPSKNETN